MNRFRQLQLHAALVVLVIATFVPFVVMGLMSLRSSLDIVVNFWGLPRHPAWSNYSRAFSELAPAMVNTFLVCLVAVAGSLFISLLAGYAFARHEFPGKRLLFALIMGLMMVPGVLLLAPRYVLAVDFGLRDTYWGLWWFYLSGGQVLGIYLIRTFIAALPEDLFEAARIEGAGEWSCLFRIALPLTQPILVTVGILLFLTTYNDLIWPMLVLNDPRKDTLMLALLQFTPSDPQSTNRTELGVQAAGYVCASLPVVIVFWMGMKAYIRGVLAGGIKE